MKHKSVKFECPKCGYICSSASGLKKHRLAFHRPDAIPDEGPLGFVGSGKEQQAVAIIRYSETAELQGVSPESNQAAGQQGGGGGAVGSCQLSRQHDSFASANQTPPVQTPGVQSVGVSGFCQSPAPVLYSNVPNVIFETVDLTQKNDRSLSFSEY